MKTNYLILKHFIFISIVSFLLGCSFDARINEKTIGSNLELDRFIDKEYNIVCYQSKRSYQSLSCVRIKE